MLDFEAPILELDETIEELETFSTGTNQDCAEQIERLRRRRDELIEQLYADLTPWQRVQVARHPNRPVAMDFMDEMFSDMVEVKGDKVFADDAAIVCTFAKFRGRKVMVIAHRKGRNTGERLQYNFGCPHPEGYRKAARAMRLAEKFHLPVVTLINTPGAYPGIEAEKRGQAQAIAESIQTMTGLRVPIVAAVIGEGGSGGALAIGVADRLLMMRYTYLSVISPEGCSAILWKSSAHAQEAAENLRLSAQELVDLGVCDAVIDEPAGGAHRFPKQAIACAADALARHLDEICRIRIDALLEMRHDRLRRIGRFEETPPADGE